MSIIRKYILVDDDSFNNILCTMAIESTLGEVNIKSFEVPERGLEFIQFEYMHSLGPAVLFLDINMPTLTGWEFLDEYAKFNDVIKSQISIYMLSSSVDHRDRDKAGANQYIKGFISKPLEKDSILLIAGS